jgi:heat shock protein HtpX
MATALGAVAIIYLAAFLFAVLLIITSWRDGEPRGVFAGALILTGAPALLRKQFIGSAERVLRALRARPEPVGDRLVPVAAKLAALASVRAPDVIVSHSRTAEALAVPTQGKPLVIVTTELLRKLSDRELDAVLAHEISHLANRDGSVMVFVGGPALMCAGLWHGDDVRGKIAVVLFLWPLWLIGLALMRAISRYREYAADRGSAVLTGEPEQLMSALTKIAGITPSGDLRGGAAISALCISGRSTGWLPDHPPLEKRLKRLAAIARAQGRPIAV